MRTAKTCKLALEDGLVFTGTSFGAAGPPGLSKQRHSIVVNYRTASGYRLLTTGYPASPAATQGCAGYQTKGT